MKLIFPRLLVAVLLLQSNLQAQVKTTEFKNWSKWIPIVDRNENKVLISVDLEPYSALVDDKTVWFNYKLLNKYSEPISGRLLYSYISPDGLERQMSCTIYSLQPDEEYFNFIHSQIHVSKITDIKFVEFSPCSANSKLIGYHAGDSTIFSLYDAIKREEANKQSILTSSDDSKKKGIIRDNSDAVINYKGKNEEIVHSLLSKAKGWKTNSGLQIRDGMPPSMQVDNQCQRDSYVYSAVLYAWAAESYYRIQEFAKGEEAAGKIADLLKMADQLCGNGGLHFQGGSCKTESIYPCPGSNTQTAGQNMAAAPAAMQGGLASNNSTSQAGPAADFSDEKKLFAGLLPVISSASSGNDGAFATSMSNFTDNLSSYADKDSSSSGLEKAFLKLVAIDVKMQANEIISNSRTSSNLTSAPGSFSNSNNAVATSSPGTPKNFNQMNSFQQREYVEGVVNSLAPLFDRKENANGLTNAEQKRRDKLEETIKSRNAEYREKYGYTVRQFTDAIRNFDDALLNKILDSGFPIDTKVIHDDLNNEINCGGIYSGPDYWLTGLHYAAEYGNDYAVKKFVEKGLSVNQKAYGFFNGAFPRGYVCQPIDMAVYYERYSTVKLLIELGSTLNNKSSYPVPGGAQSPLRAAKAMKYYDITKLLEQYSGKK